LNFLIFEFSGFQMTAAYTWSHLIDDTTAEVNSTVLSPRRVQDFQNLRAERADSALDHRHRLVMSWIYELPWFRKSGGLTEALLGGFHVSGTYTYETGERITIRSGNDAFNHPQYVPGSVNTVDPVNTSGLTTLNQITPLTSDFLNPSHVLSSNPRVIQLALRFNF
jgi:hypothetical protein